MIQPLFITNMNGEDRFYTKDPLKNGPIYGIDSFSINILALSPILRDRGLMEISFKIGTK